MNFADGLFGSAWTLGALPVYLLFLAHAARTAPWRTLVGDARRPGLANAWMGALVVLTLLWSLKAGVKPGLDLHFLGATALTLMFGRSLALVGLSVVLAAVTFNAGMKGVPGWEAFALNALVFVVCPVFVAHALLGVIERWLPANVFIFIFGAAFFGGGLAALAVGGGSSLLLWAGGIYEADLLLSDYLPYYVLLAFAEGWLNGGAIALMVVYYPHWVTSFDDRRYLWQKK